MRKVENQFLIASARGAKAAQWYSAGHVCQEMAEEAFAGAEFVSSVMNIASDQNREAN